MKSWSQSIMRILINKRSFRQILFFFLFENLVALVFGVLVYGISSRQLKEHIIESNRRELELVNDSMHMLDDELVRLSNQLTLDPVIINLPRLHWREDLRTIITRSGQLYNFSVVNEYLHSIWIYYPEKDVYFNPSIGFVDLDYAPRLLARESYQEGNYLRYHWKPDVIKSMSPPFLDEEILVITETIPLNSPDPAAVLQINIKKQALEERVDLITDREAGEAIAFFNRENQIILGENPLGIKPSIPVDSANTTRIIRYMGKDYFLNRFDLPEEKWFIISVLPIEQVFGILRRFRGIYYILLIVTLITGSILAILFSRSVIRPMVKLVEFFEDDSIFFQDEDFYHYLSDKIIHLARENTDLARLLTNSRSVLKNDFLQKSLNGWAFSINSEDTKRSSQDLGLKIQMDKPCRVMKIHVRASASEGEDHPFLYAALMETEKEFSQYSLKTEYCLDPCGDISIILSGEEQDLVKDHLSNPCSIIIKQWNQWIDAPVLAGLGGICKNFASIDHSHEEAEKALNLLRIRGGTGTIFLEDAIGHVETIKYPYRLESRLLQALRLGKREESLTILRKIMRSIPFGEEVTSSFYLQIYFFLLKFIHESGYALDDFSIENFFLCRNPEEIGRFLSNMIIHLIESQKARQSGERQELISELKRFIQDNLDKDISLTRLADHAKLSHTYLSRVFKEEAGVNLKQFITDIRMERAKEYLRKSDKTNVQIARLVGYDSVQGFLAIFKKTVGQSPGRYRHYRNHQDNNQEES